MASQPESDFTPTLYETIESLPRRVVGEIVAGGLYVHPRPSARHGVAATRFGADINAPFDRGRGGPGGWWIIVEPEVHFRRDEELMVPDVAGWRRERLPDIPDDQRFLVVPDWLLEVASPSTASYDRQVKMPRYAHYGVRHVWIADPVGRTLEAFELGDGAYREIARFGPDDTIVAPPFEAVGIEPPWV